MESYFAPFLILTILEVLYSSDLIIHSHSVSRLAENKNIFSVKKIYLALVSFKVVIVLLLISLVSFLKFSFDIFGIKIGLDKFFYLLGGIFLISKNIGEFYEIYNLKPKVSSSNISTTLPFIELIKHLIYFSLLISYGSFSLALSLSPNLILILLANITAIIIAYLFAVKLVKLFNRFYRLRVISIIFSMLLGLALIVYTVGINIENLLLLIILVFTILCEVVSIFCSKRHRINGVRKSN